MVFACFRIASPSVRSRSGSGRAMPTKAPYCSIWSTVHCIWSICSVMARQRSAFRAAFPARFRASPSVRASRPALIAPLTIEANLPPTCVVFLIFSVSSSNTWTCADRSRAQRFSFIVTRYAVMRSDEISKRALDLRTFWLAISRLRSMLPRLIIAFRRLDTSGAGIVNQNGASS